MLEWISQWPYGGQGHIHVETVQPNNQRDWELKVRFPSKCPLNAIKFWSACTVDDLNLPEEGIFVLEQVIFVFSLTQENFEYVGDAKALYRQNFQASLNKIAENVRGNSKSQKQFRKT